MNTLLALPILIPLFTATLCVLGWRSRNLQRAAGAAGATALLVNNILLLRAIWQNGPQAMQAANWPAPFGITLVADLLAASMLLVAGIMGLLTVIYSMASVGAERERYGYYALFHVLLMGVCGSFLTGDIFNLYVWFEVMLIASFVLMALGGQRAQIEGSLKYVTINLVASGFFLAASGLLYSVTGTLNMADLAQRIPANEHPALIGALSMLFMVAFGIKAGMFPLFFWLPASYHTPPIPVTALFAGLLTKVGVYTLIRSFSLIFVQDIPFTHTILLVLAGFTMVSGVLGAVSQIEVRRLLAFHIISQIGYMIMGLAFMTPLGLAGAVFHAIHNIIAKSNLFLISGIMYQVHGTYNLKKLGGLYASHPYLSILFLTSAFSLAGIPPLAGFFSKFLLVRAGLEAGHYEIVIIALLVGILTLYSMTKIWAEAFWKPLPASTRAAGEEPRSMDRAAGPNALQLWIPAATLSVLTLALGISAGPYFEFWIRLGEELMNPTAYIQAVLRTES